MANAPPRTPDASRIGGLSARNANRPASQCSQISGWAWIRYTLKASGETLSIKRPKRGPIFSAVKHSTSATAASRTVGEVYAVSSTLSQRCPVRAIHSRSPARRTSHVASTQPA